MANNSGEKKKGIFHTLLYREVEAPAEAPADLKPVVVSPLSARAAVMEADQNIYTQLAKVLVDNNLEGYDYFEFRSAVENMKAIIPGEAERFRAAYAAVASMVTPDKLAASIEFYLGKLVEKKTEFDQSVKAMVVQKVESKECQAKNLDSQISDTTKQITDLTTHITQLQGERTKALNEAMIEKSRIESVQSKFTVTYQKLISEITGDQTKIKTYLTKGVA